MKAHWIVGIAMAAGFSSRAEECPVNVYMHSGINGASAVAAMRAEAEAAVMFREIGVTIRWLMGPVRAGVDGDCGTSMEVEIDQTANRLASPEALAYATPYAQSASLIHVFADRVAQTTAGKLSATVLAHVLAHEITHVLEGVCRHSPDGLMKAHWEFRDYLRMESHPLAFDPADVQLIHLGLAARSARVMRAAERRPQSALPLVGN